MRPVHRHQDRAPEARAGGDAVSAAGVRVDGRELELEYCWVGADAGAPLMVFLHEGLGSVALWKDFPRQVCEALGMRGLVYSRPGYGASTPRAPHERWGADFLHVQAERVLPALLEHLGVAREPRWLFGHSDGGSIALLHAARFPAAVVGAVVLAPHVLVEDVALRNIEKTRAAYLAGDLRRRLARHHRDPDSAFWGWNDAWLDPGFRAWDITAELGAIRCPVLAVQGVDDEYGTLEQIRIIARHVAATRLLELGQCGHVPHRDQPEALLRAVREFVGAAGPGSARA